jgi:anti-sigma B factor antagonist
MEPTWRCEVQCHLEDGVAVLTVTGRVGSEGAPQLGSELRRLIDAGHQRLRVDLAGVDYMNSAGLEVVAAAAQQLTGTGGALALSGLREPVRLALAMAGLTATIRIDQ